MMIEEDDVYGVDAYMGYEMGSEAIRKMRNVLQMPLDNVAAIDAALVNLLDMFDTWTDPQPLLSSIDLATFPEQRSRLPPPPRAWRLDPATGLPSRDNPQQLTDAEWAAIMPAGEIDEALAD